VPLYYLRGGGMVLRATVTARDQDPIALFVDSSRPFPLLLQDAAWKLAGVDLTSLASLLDSPNVKHGTVPVFRVGGFDLARMPAIEGLDMGELATGLDVTLGGVVGADLLAFFRVTFADDGRFIWIEPDPMLLGPTSSAAGAAPAPATNPAAGSPTPATPASSAPPGPAAPGPKPR
jgi:hypothetical protein